MPVWHVSVSLRGRRGRLVGDPVLLEEWALDLLVGVGGPWERWRISPAAIGHLHVPVTAAEFDEIPPGPVFRRRRGNRPRAPPLASLTVEHPRGSTTQADSHAYGRAP